MSRIVAVAVDDGTLYLHLAGGETHYYEHAADLPGSGLIQEVKGDCNSLIGLDVAWSAREMFDLLKSDQEGYIWEFYRYDGTEPLLSVRWDGKASGYGGTARTRKGFVPIA